MLLVSSCIASCSDACAKIVNIMCIHNFDADKVDRV